MRVTSIGVNVRPVAIDLTLALRAVQVRGRIAGRRWYEGELICLPQSQTSRLLS